jgi:carbamoyl-phosphate synthase large subunit
VTRSRLAVVVLSAGRRVELCEIVRAEVTALGFTPVIVAADADPTMSAACAIADQAARMPAVADTSYVDELLDLCAREDARLVIPTIDPELQPIADRQTDFDRTGIVVNISHPEAVRIARHKGATAAALRAVGISVPRWFDSEDEAADALRAGTPLVVKPVGGSSSVGVVFPSTPGDLHVVLADRPDVVIQERIQGVEYTVNVFADAEGTVVSAVPHERLQVRGGEVAKARTVRHAKLEAIAIRLPQAVPGLRGAFCFQAMGNGERASVIEINARFGGGYPLAHRAGATHVRWLLEHALGRDSTAHGRWEQDLTMLRFDSSVFRARQECS